MGRSADTPRRCRLLRLSYERGDISLKQWELRGVVVDVAQEDPALGIGPMDEIDVPRLLVEQFPILVWTTDLVLCFTSSTGAGLNAVGLGPNQMVGVTLFDFFETDDPRFPVISAHLRALAGESVSFEMRLAGRLFHCRVAPLDDVKGEQIGTICVALDARQDHRARSRAGMLARAG